VWVVTFDLSDVGGPTSSYATASIALRIIGPLKPHHYVKVGILSGLWGTFMNVKLSTKNNGGLWSESKEIKKISVKIYAF